jgi:Kef-type K+ transport system membrane component KefB
VLNNPSAHRSRRLIRDIKDIDALAELGILFLLFEMGLELSIDRLKALAKYAFGMGGLQMLICIVAFTAFALPLGAGVGTVFLERISDAPDSLVTIRSLDEAIVIGASLSLSSSAFVLQLLGERGEMQTRFGAATLGILLLQDIAVVPFLVLLPLIEDGHGVSMDGASPVSLLAVLGPTVLKTVAGLGALLLGGRFVLRRIFELVAESKSSESFISLCLLTVVGASQLTQLLGLSDTMGAFIAGVLLSETSYRTQVGAWVSRAGAAPCCRRLPAPPAPPRASAANA